MKRIAFTAAMLLLSLGLSFDRLAADEPKLTNVRVIAYEYYDYYALPDRPKFKKVRSVRIEGQNRAGSTQVYQTGPSTEIEAVRYDVSVPSTYYVTVYWVDGERYYQSFTSEPRSENILRVHQPY